MCKNIHVLAFILTSLSLWSSNIAFAFKKCLKKGKPWRLLHLSHSHIFPSEFLLFCFILKHIQLGNQFPCQKQSTRSVHCAAGNPLFFISLYPQTTSVVCSHDRQKQLICFHGNSCDFHVFDSLSLKSSIIRAPATTNKTDN